MQKSNKQGGQKTSAFDAKFEKFANKLPKDYKEQFKKPDYKGPSKDTKVRTAMRQGKNVEHVVKSKGNKAGGPDINMAKVMDDEHVIEIKEIPKSIAGQVAKLRAEKKLTQPQFAVKINEKEATVKDLENAEGVYNPKIIEKIEKTFSVKLDRPHHK